MPRFNSYRSYKAIREDYTQIIYNTFMKNWVNYIKFGSDPVDLEDFPDLLGEDMKAHVMGVLKGQISMSASNKVLIEDILNAYLDQVNWDRLADNYIASVLDGEPV